MIVCMTAAASLLALLFAVLTARKVLKFDEGTDVMKKISQSVRKGANAYLNRQYRIVVVFFGVLFAVLGIMAFAGLLTP